MSLKVKNSQIVLYLSVLIGLFVISFLNIAYIQNVHAQSLTNVIDYSNPIYNINIQYPSDWEKNETNYNVPDVRVKTIVSFYPPLENPSDPFYDSLVVYRDEGIFYQADLDEYLDEVIEIYESNLVDFELLQSFTTSTLDGKPAYSLTYTYTFEAENGDGDDIPVKGYEIGTLVNNNNSAYSITFDAEENVFDDYFPIAQGMINTFTISPLSTPTPENQITIPNGFSEYINSGYGVKTIYPSNYDVTPPSPEDIFPGEIVTFFSPFRSTLDSFREYVTLMVNNIDGTITPNMQDYLNSIVSSLSELDYEIVDSTTDYKLAGNPAIKIEYVQFIEDGSELHTMLVSAIVNNKEFSFRFDAEGARFQEYLPVVEQMINSFEIIQNPIGDGNRNITGVAKPFVEIYNSVQWLSDNLAVHLLVNQDTQEQASQYLPVVEEAINQWSTLLKQHSGNYNAWNFDITSSVGYLDNLGANGSKDIIIEITGDPQALLCNEAYGIAETLHQDFSKGIPVGVFTSCVDEEGNTVDFPEDEVYSTALHEFGHSLGLGHAFYMNGDLMCSTDYDNSGNVIETCTSSVGKVEPSEADIMALLYKYGKDGFTQPNRELVGIRPIYQPGTPI